MGLNTAKKSEDIKSASNKSCPEVKFRQKAQWAHVCISPKSGAKELWRLICLIYIDVLKWEIRFFLGLNTGENTYYIRKCQIEVINIVSLMKNIENIHMKPFFSPKSHKISIIFLHSSISSYVTVIQKHKLRLSWKWNLWGFQGEKKNHQIE